MAKGVGPDPNLRGIALIVESEPLEDDQPGEFDVHGQQHRLIRTQIRVQKKGQMIRCERADGTPMLIRGPDFVWTWDEGGVPIKWPGTRNLFHGPAYALTHRRELDEWSGNDFTTPTGPVVATRFLDRGAWQVELAPPSHKPFPLSLIVDADTGLVLSQRNEGFGSVTEWQQLEVGADLSDDLFDWQGESRPPPDRTADHERDMAVRREWLSGQGIHALTLSLPAELMPHEWSEDGSFLASVEVGLHATLLRRPQSREPWQTRLGWQRRYEWRSGNWDWLLATDVDISENLLEQLKAQLP